MREEWGRGHREREREKERERAVELSHAREFQVDPLACMQSPAREWTSVIVRPGCSIHAALKEAYKAPLIRVRRTRDPV